MAFNSPLDPRAAHSSFQTQTDAAFASAANAQPILQKRLTTELSATGFIACALTAALLGSTPNTARADAKKATPKAVLVSTTKSRVATSQPKPQISVAKNASVASIVARPRVSSLNTLKPVAASSQHTEKPQSEDLNIPEKRPAPATTCSANADIVVEVLFAAPAPRQAILLAAAPVEAPAEVTTTQTAEQVANQTEADASPAKDAAGEPPTTTNEKNAAAQPAGSTPNTETEVVPTPAPVVAAPVTTPVPAPVSAPENATPSNTPVASPSRLYAPSISYDGGTIIAQGTPENPVRLESAGARIVAQSVRLDTVGKTVTAQGKVRVERQVMVSRFSAFRTNGRNAKATNETVTETLQGEDFEYNYETRQGKLGATSVRLASFNIQADSLTINGQKYVAHNVIVRPGGLSEEELKIYGTPPFNLRARDFTVDTSKPATSGAGVSDTGKDDGASVDLGGRAYAKGAALYFKNTRLLPVPSAFLNRSLGRREQPTYQITPRISTNATDGILVTTRMYFPIARENPDRLSLAADIGLSTKIGFRGGVQLESSTSIGKFTFGARVNDIVDTQLTNRIELDRLPELQYRPPSLALFALPGGRSAGLKFGFIAGDYRERFSDGSRETRSSRLQGQVRFTTRLARADGPYLDLFARASQYSVQHDNLRTAGFEVGYSGPLTNRLAGQFSYSATSVSGSTPFRFDEIEIRKELRATFDIMLTPRYIIPIDLRYDVDRHKLRDKTFGLLRNYKTFAYGVTYQSVRRELRFEIRQGF